MIFASSSISSSLQEKAYGYLPIVICMFMGLLYRPASFAVDIYILRANVPAYLLYHYVNAFQSLW